MSGYFQIEFTADEDASAFSEDENEIHVHYDRSSQDSPHQLNPRSSSTPKTSDESNRSRLNTRSRTLTPVPYKAFLFFYCLLILLTGCACRAYLHGILRLIQRTVYVSDAEIRVMALAYDIGLIFALLPFSCSNTTIHRPKLLGSGAAFIGLGLLFACIPYFIMKAQLPQASHEKDDYELCIAPDELISTFDVVTEGSDNSTTSLTTNLSTDENPWSTIWLIIGMLLAGVGSAPQFVVGIPYIDDTVTKPSIQLCIALVLSTQFGGIWLGQLASFFMWHHISVADPQMLTRWWLGFFVAAMGALVSGLIIFMFRDPAKRQPEVPKEKSPQNFEDTCESPYYQRLRDDSSDSASNVTSVPSRVSRLARNVPFIFLNLGGAFEAALLTGLLVFQPRYLGTVTSHGIAPAQLFTGSAITAGVVIGLVIGTYFIYSRKWSPKKLSRIALFASVPALCFGWALFFFHCGDPDIIGGIRNSQNYLKTSRNFHELLNQANGTVAPCPLDCSCSSAEITPVCGSDHLTYLSPCFAGCRNVVEIDKPDFDGHKTLNFTDCTCVNGTMNLNAPPRQSYALSGACPVKCSPSWLYWIVLCAMCVCAGIQYTPQMLLMIRCVVPRDRAAALSILVITWHLVGYVPALIYFSYALNKSCILWSDVDNQTYHECVIYDSGTHHLYISTLTVFLKSLSVVCTGITHKFTKDTQERGDRNWVQYDVLEMDSYNRRDMNESGPPAYI